MANTQLEIATTASILIRTGKGRGMFGFRKYHEGDTCPECSKRELMAITGRSLVTFGHPALWLVCDGYPRCGFATRRILKNAPEANDKQQPSLPFLASPQSRPHIVDTSRVQVPRRARLKP